MSESTPTKTETLIEQPTTRAAPAKTDETTQGESSPACELKKPLPSPKKQRSRSKSLPRGKYTLVGIDIDTTGRRLIDEVVQLAAYTPDKQFSQYVMPYMNLNPAARQRHQLRVLTIGFLRILKSMQTYKVVKTKSEIAALMDFLVWIEELRKSEPDSQGIILIYHEKRKFIPYMLLEAFNKYNLLSRFLSSVRSFANGYDFASAKCANTVKYLNLRQLSKVLLNITDEEEEKEKKDYYFERNASVRARMAFEITQHLAKGEQKDLNKEMEMANMGNVIYEYSHPVSHEIAELRNQRKILEMQNSLRSIFVQYFKTALYHRVKAVTFRRVLSENGQDFDSLKALWDEKKHDGLATLIEPFDLSNEEKSELIELLDCHFDPAKSPMKPPMRPRRKSRSRTNSRRSRNNSSSTSNNQKENMTPSPKKPEQKQSQPAPDSSMKTKLEQNNNVLVSPPQAVPV